MYYIGVDGGGTKTLFSLYDENGNLLKNHVEGTCHYAQVGYDGLEIVIKTGVDVLTQGLDGDVKIGLGLAGYGREIHVRKNMEEAMKRALPHHDWILKNDAQVALMGALDGQDGILVIAGTGSIAISRYNGVEDRCGGWGYAIGDEGSAYWIGKKILLAFSRQSDGREEKTALYHLLKEETGIQDDADIITYVIKTLENKREKIATLAIICAKGASMNDPACLAIYREAASEISQIINVLGRKANQENILVSYTGGVWKGRQYMQATFNEKLDANVQIIEPLHGPDYGAYLYAKTLG